MRHRMAAEHWASARRGVKLSFIIPSGFQQIGALGPAAFDVICRSKTFLLFLAKDLVADDAAKLDATFDQAVC